VADDTSTGDANDAALDEWEKMLAAEENGGGDAAAAGGDAPPDQPARVLNQDEIDLLLGFDSSGDDSDKNQGIHAILDKALMAYEKMPMLEVVFDRLVRMLSSSLRNFMSDNVDVSLESMASLRFDDYLNSIPLPAMLAVFRAVEWENFGLVTVDSSQIYSTVDVLFGGRRSNRPIRIEGRPYTTIEQDIVKQMVDIVLDDMSSAFDPLSPVSFQFDRLENNPRFATITRPNNAALLVRLRVDMEERGGIIELLFPHTTLEPIRDMLLQMFMGEKFGQDTVWERHLGHEVRQTNVDVDVVLDQKTLPLGDVMNLKVGNTLMLDALPRQDVLLKCGDVALGKARIGRVGDSIAVSLNDPISKQIKELNQS
jgi:flagellar motor switch protein FliM